MDERRRVLITVEFYYAPGGGGIAEQARQIAEGLVKRGHEVTVATSMTGDRPATINGVRVEAFSVSGNLVKGIYGEKERYSDFLKNYQGDAIINLGANVWTTDLAFPLLVSLKTKKILSTPGLSKINDPRYQSYYRGPYREALSRYDKIVYTSANYRDKTFGDEQGFSDKAVIIPNGASETEFLATITDFKTSHGIITPHLFITVSNHYFAKGHTFVIDAFNRLDRNDATLAIIGHQPGRHRWYSCYWNCRFKSWRNPRIKLFTDLPRDEVVSAYKSADAFLFGSELECAPLVMYEAFAAKLPFITRNVGSVSDHRDYLEIVESPRQMAKAAAVLLERPERRAQLVDAAFADWRKNHSWNRISGAYEALLCNL